MQLGTLQTTFKTFYFQYSFCKQSVPRLYSLHFLQNLKHLPQFFWCAIISDFRQILTIKKTNKTAKSSTPKNDVNENFSK